MLMFGLFVAGFAARSRIANQCIQELFAFESYLHSQYFWRIKVMENSVKAFANEIEQKEGKQNEGRKVKAHGSHPESPNRQMM